MKGTTADLMTRREALRRAACVIGGAISAPTVAAVLAGCDSGREIGGARGAAAWTPRSLSTEQDELVLVLGEHILPETDTPGARAARVNEFIDAMLTDFYPAERRERFLAGLDRVTGHAQRLFGSEFAELSGEQQRQLVLALNRAAFPDRRERPEPRPDDASVLQEGEDVTGREEGPGSAVAPGQDHPWDPDDAGRGSFFAGLKELVLVGFYTSEVGANQELRTMPVMGPWRADIPYTEVGRSWA